MRNCNGICLPVRQSLRYKLRPSWLLPDLLSLPPHPQRFRPGCAPSCHPLNPDAPAAHRSTDPNHRRRSGRLPGISVSPTSGIPKNQRNPVFLCRVWLFTNTATTTL